MQHIQLYSKALLTGLLALVGQPVYVNHWIHIYQQVMITWESKAHYSSSVIELGKDLDSELRKRLIGVLHSLNLQNWSLTITCSLVSYQVTSFLGHLRPLQRNTVSQFEALWTGCSIEWLSQVNALMHWLDYQVCFLCLMAYQLFRLFNAKAILLEEQ